jgi:hypothetical protein
MRAARTIFIVWLAIIGGAAYGLHALHGTQVLRFGSARDAHVEAHKGGHGKDKKASG